MLEKEVTWEMTSRKEEKVVWDCREREGLLKSRLWWRRGSRVWARGPVSRIIPPAGSCHVLAGASVGTQDRKAVLTLTLITVDVCLSREKHHSLKHPRLPSIRCLSSPVHRPSLGSTAPRGRSAASANQIREGGKGLLSCFHSKLSFS